MHMKMKVQNLAATPAAEKVALDVIDRERVRPHFGNGGAVETLLGKAKNHYQARQSLLPRELRSHEALFEPEDFDKEYNRAANASANLAKLFEDIVGHADIVKRLEGYQKVAKTCQETGRDPRNQVPTNFVFTGPPGM